MAERQGAAKDVFHTFLMGVYFFPLLGGFGLSDRFAGKYKTIYGFSLLYCLGHGLLSVFESSKTGFYLGLFFIALGSGGIKPLVSSFVGDQFDNKSSCTSKNRFCNILLEHQSRFVVRVHVYETFAQLARTDHCLCGAGHFDVYRNRAFCCRSKTLRGHATGWAQSAWIFARGF